MPANTSPDNIQFPVAGDQIAPLNTVFQNVAQTTQNAFSLRANFSYRWANTAARTGQTGMRNGDRGFQVDTAVWYERIAGAWVLDYEVLTNAFTARAGYTISTQQARRSGRVVTLTATVTKSTAWAPATGADDFGDLTVAVLRPGVDFFGGGINGSNVAACVFAIQSIGGLRIFNANGVAGTTPMVLSATYVIA